MHFEIYQEGKPLSLLAQAGGLLGKGQWRWRLRADNGEIIASGESFHTEQACRDSIALVMQANSLTTRIQRV